MQKFLNLTLEQEVPRNVQGETEQFNWQWLDHGVLLLEPKGTHSSDLDSMLISAGIHGNETAPIELLDFMLQDLFAAKLTLAVRLLVIFGNPPAMRQGIRYDQIDLNRLFSGHHKKFLPCYEAERAERLQTITKTFFEQANKGKNQYHLDLHTAIRGSKHTRFAVYPYRETPANYSRDLFDWLAASQVEAVVLNQEPSSTFSYFSNRCGAESCTLELGKAKPFGQNDISQFQVFFSNLKTLISHGIASRGVNRVEISENPIKVYQVSQQLTKLSEAFELNFSDEVENFTAFRQGDILATDQDTVYSVKQPQEFVLFPNAKVRPNLRAGLMLVEIEPNNLFDT
ncbi:MAG: succinylglutamate desuccinylase [Vibrio sp.]